MNRTDTMNKLRNALAALAPLTWTALSPALLAAQSSTNQIGGMRAYWHVFIAYAIAIVLVLGWVVSIGRRLKDIEERLDR
jgi:CcmD family protein